MHLRRTLARSNMEGSTVTKWTVSSFLNTISGRDYTCTQSVGVEILLIKIFVVRGPSSNTRERGRPILIFFMAFNPFVGYEIF